MENMNEIRKVGAIRDIMHHPQEASK